MTARESLLALLGSRPFVGEKALETWAKSHKPPVPWSEAMALTAQLCKEGLAVESCVRVGGQPALRWSLASGAPAPAPAEEEANDVVTSAPVMPAAPAPSKPRGRPPKAPAQPPAPPPVVAPSPPPPPPPLAPAAPLALVPPPSIPSLPGASDEGEEDSEEWPSAALLLDELLAWPPTHLTWFAQAQAKRRRLHDEVDAMVALYINKKKEMKILRDQMERVADAVIRTPNGEVPPALATLLAESIEAAE